MTSKECSTCCEVLPLSAFNRNCRAKDGRVSRCKGCEKKYYGKYYQKNKAKILEKHRKYLQSPAGRGVQRKVAAKQRLKFPEKRKAYDAFKYAVIQGKVVKQPCSCGDAKVEAHHEDYSKPLDVVWMCRQCHINLHSLQGVSHGEN